LMSIEEHSDLYLISKWQNLPADKMLAAVTDRRTILDAIRLRDPDAAARASHDHARAVRLRWRDLYKSETTP
jgi:DNA-binding FadR family transcriptional regulator